MTSVFLKLFVLTLYFFLFHVTCCFSHVSPYHARLRKQTLCHLLLNDATPVIRL